MKEERDFLKLLTHHQDSIRKSIGDEQFETLLQAKQRFLYGTQHAKHMKKRYQYSSIFLLLLVCSSALMLWGKGWYVAWQEQFFAAEDVQHAATIQVKSKALSSHLRLTGVISSSERADVFSPVQGNIEQINFKYGDWVEKGKVLLVIDSQAEKIKYQQLKSAYQQELKKLDTLKHWHKSLEVKQAKRDLHILQYKKQQIQQEVTQNKVLLAQGFIAATEITQQENNLRDMRFQIETAQERFVSTLEKGSQDQVDLQALLLSSKLYELEASEKRLLASQVVSPISGIVFQKEQNNRRRKVELAATLAVGMPIKDREPLVSIVNMDALRVSTQVDELQFVKIKEGQQATITLDVYPNILFKGQVDTIEKKAHVSQGYRRNISSYFKVFIALHDVSDEHHQLFHVGMSAGIHVTLQENEHAIVIPLSAVFMHKDTAWVYRVEASSPQPQKTKIKTGIMNIDEVEVLQGLQEGDVLLKEPPLDAMRREER